MPTDHNIERIENGFTYMKPGYVPPEFREQVAAIERERNPPALHVSGSIPRCEHLGAGIPGDLVVLNVRCKSCKGQPVMLQKTFQANACNKFGRCLPHYSCTKDGVETVVSGEFTDETKLCNFCEWNPVVIERLRKLEREDNQAYFESNLEASIFYEENSLEKHLTALPGIS